MVLVLVLLIYRVSKVKLLVVSKGFSSKLRVVLPVENKTSMTALELHRHLKNSVIK